MRKIIRVLFLALLVIPILTISQARANGPSHPSFHGSNQSFLERLFHGVFGYRDDHNIKNHPDGNHPDGGTNGSNSGGTRAPLDGGLSILLAAGIGLGVKKAFKKKDHQEEGKELS